MPEHPGAEKGVDGEVIRPPDIEAPLRRYVVQLKGKLSDFWLENLIHLVPDLSKIDEDAKSVWLMGKFSEDAKSDFIKAVLALDSVSIVSIKSYDVEA